MTRPLLEKKWELERAKTCLYRRRDELKEQEARVDGLSEEYMRALKTALADAKAVRRVPVEKRRPNRQVL